MQSILLLSGPVAAGKTTIARELVASASVPVTHIEEDTGDAATLAARIRECLKEGRFRMS